MDCSLPGSSVHGILQARILEWVAFPFFRGSSQPRSPMLQAHSSLSEPPGEPKEYWNGSPNLSPADLPNPGIELGSPELHTDSLPAELSGKSPPGCKERSESHPHPHWNDVRDSPVADFHSLQELKSSSPHAPAVSVSLNLTPT